MNDLNSNVKSILKSAAGSFLASDFDKALEQLKKAEVLDKDNPEILYNLGISYSRLELYNTALEYFRKVLELESKYIDMLNVKKNISYCLIHLEQFSESIHLLDEVLSDSPSDVAALNMKGFCLEKNGKINEALRIYSAIFRYDKKNLNSMNATAYLMARQGIELNKALEIAKFVHTKNRSNPAYNDTLGYVYFKNGNYEDAEKYLRLAYNEHPFDKEIAEHISELKKATQTDK